MEFLDARHRVTKEGFDTFITLVLWASLLAWAFMPIYYFSILNSIKKMREKLIEMLPEADRPPPPKPLKKLDYPPYYLPDLDTTEDSKNIKEKNADRRRK